ncbi:MAG: hypothetical protein BAJALOKI2v1_770001 [Promethearchaeota archaeon]|nr:MAG: hypothetical protein BAJALOKI2v1_770001 [Candidatus Lokiarchaeota archaeon]
MLFIGHRGTRKNYDENTFGAFLKALDHGADYIEFDIHKTKDDKLIIIHDETLNRTTDGMGLIKDLTYSEIKKVRTKTNKEMVPRLDSVLTKLKHKVKFMIELKGRNVLKKLMELIDQRFLIENSVISGRNLVDLKTIRTKIPNIKICYNITKGAGLSLQEFIDLGKKENLPLEFNMISLRSNLTTREFIDTCHKNNILALSWDFINYENPIKEIKSLIKQDIDGILFDHSKNIRIIKNWVNEQ